MTRRRLPRSVKLIVRPPGWRRFLAGSTATLLATSGPHPVLAQTVASQPASNQPGSGQPADTRTTEAQASSGVPSGAGVPSAYGPLDLQTLTVLGAEGGSYKPDRPSLHKLSQPLLDTPQSINVIPRQQLDDEGVTTLRDALRNVPGISLAAGEAGAQGDSLTIRGFTARNDIYLDGMRDFGSYYRDPFFLEGIQVLKGPSSILFGRGSTGGVVEQDSKLPGLEAFTRGTLAFGTDATKRATADVNEPLPDLGTGAALRLNLMVQDNSFTDRDVARNTRFGIAPSLALGLGTPTRIIFTYLHESEYDIPDYGLPWLYRGVPGQVTGLARPAPLGQAQNNFYGFSDDDYLRTNVDIPTVKIVHDFSDAVSVSNQLRYGHYTREFRITEPQLYTTASVTKPGGTGTALLISPSTPLDTLSVARNELYGSSLETSLDDMLDVSAEFRTGFVSHTLRAGLELGRETSDPVRYGTIAPYSLTPLLSPNPGDNYNANTFLSTRTNTTAETQAAYVLDTLKLDEQWQLLGGVRFDRFDAQYRQTAFANPVTNITAASVAQNRVDTMPSWRAAVVYKPLPQGTVYVDAGTSFNPSAEALSLSVATGSLAPEKNFTYEAGTKWEVLDGGLAIDGSVYHTEKDNMRETDPNNSLFQILAGDAVAEGAELEAAGRLTPDWQITAGYAYTYGVIEKSPITGVASDLGHRLGNVPAHTASLWTTYVTPWKVQVGGGINVVSSRYAATTPTIAGGTAFWKEVPGYWTLSAMARYPLTENVAAQVNLINLTDNRYYDQIHPAHVVPGAGRTALFTVNFRY